MHGWLVAVLHNADLGARRLLEPFHHGPPRANHRTNLLFGHRNDNGACSGRHLHPIQFVNTHLQACGRCQRLVVSLTSWWPGKRRNAV